MLAFPFHRSSSNGPNLIWPQAYAATGCNGPNLIWPQAEPTPTPTPAVRRRKPTGKDAEQAWCANLLGGNTTHQPGAAAPGSDMEEKEEPSHHLQQPDRQEHLRGGLTDRNTFEEA